MTSLDFSSLSLYPATKEQILEARKRHVHYMMKFKKGWTIEEWLKRDAIMDEYEHARNGRQVAWVLAPRDDPQTLDFPCSCHTFKRPSIVVRRTPSDPTVEETQSYAVSAVFTHLDQWGKGYATHMLRLLHWVLAPRDTVTLPNFPAEWGAPPNVPPSFGDALFSFLSSDIGSKFYEGRGPTAKERGWVVGDHYHTLWNNISANSLLCSPDSVNGEWRYLKEDTAKIIWDKDAGLMKEEAAAFMRSSTSCSTAFAILPNKGLAAYYFYRQMRISPYGAIKLPTDTWGVQLIASDAADPDEPAVFATWLIERQKDPQILLISRLRATPETFPALLAKINETAKKEGLNQVEIYNLPKELEAVARELGGVTSSRKHSLPMLKWYGPEEEEQVDWLYNEEYFVC